MTRSVIAFSFYPDTGEFIGLTDAFESPLEPGIFLYPAHSTSIEPPSFDSTQVCVFDGEAWHLSARPVEPDPELPPDQLP
jgi:hypothetical protein